VSQLYYIENKDCHVLKFLLFNDCFTFGEVALAMKCACII